MYYLGLHELQGNLESAAVDNLHCVLFPHQSPLTLYYYSLDNDGGGAVGNRSDDKLIVPELGEQSVCYHSLGTVLSSRTDDRLKWAQSLGGLKIPIPVAWLLMLHQ